MKCHKNPPHAVSRMQVFGRLALPVMLLGWGGQVGAQTAPNLNTDPDFTYGRWVFEGEGGTITRIVPPSTSYPSFNEACIPVANYRTSLTSTAWARNHFHLPGVVSLEKDTLYRLSFYARWNGASTRRATSKLVATVSGGKRANVYVDRLLDLTNGQTRFDIEFVTPEGTAGDAVHTMPTDIAFQAWASQGGDDGARMCVNQVSLTRVRPNTEVMVPTTPVIRYNQVVTGPEDASGNTFFTIVNPPAGSSVHVVSASSGVQPLRPRLITQADIVVEPYSGLPVVSVPVAFGSGIYKLELRDGGGRVLAETPFLKGTPAPILSGPYSVAAANLRRDALHFFYAQRAGQAIVDGRYSEYRNPFSREAGHVDERAKCFSGKDNFGNDFSGACKSASGSDLYALLGRDVSGGWYDAGDHGKYVVNGAVSLWALHNVIESHPSTTALNSYFPDGYLMYGTNGVSDLLDEAKHEMRWLLKMQIKTPLRVSVPLGGTVAKGQDVGAEADAEFGAMLDNRQTRVDNGVVLTEEVPTQISYLGYTMPRVKVKLKLSEIDANGMVFSAVRDAKWTGLPLRPSQDKEGRVLDYPTTNATLSFAAVAAQCARIWKTLDPAFASECKSAAISAWEAALRHPDVYRYGEYSDGRSIIVRAINEGGGAYSDTDASDAKLWAALELYLAESAAGVADNSTAQTYLKQASTAMGTPFNFDDEEWAQGFTWKYTRNLGLLSLLANGRDAEFPSKVKTAANIQASRPSRSLMKLATSYVDLISETAFGVPHSTTEVFNWASNADIANQAGLLLQAYKYSTDSSLKPGYLAAARRTMSYLLGNNPVGKSYVTGYGTNPVRNPHHRFWAKHKNIAFPPAPPGMLVGGPNAKWQGTLAGAEYLGGSWTLKNNRDAEMYMRDIMPNCMPADAMGLSCYQDKVGLYMTNEVALNWNAALFWAVSFLK